MKNSNIILATYLGILIIGLTISILKFNHKSNLKGNVNDLKELEMQPFTKINLTGNLHVTLAQNQKQKVAIDKNAMLATNQPRIEVIDNTLIIDASTLTGLTDNTINVSIDAPDLEDILVRDIKKMNINHWDAQYLKLTALFSHLNVSNLTVDRFEVMATDNSWIDIDSCQTNSMVLNIEKALLKIHSGHLHLVSGELQSLGKFQFGCPVDTLQLRIDKTSALNKY